MSTKTIEVSCPCCSSQIVVDVVTGKASRADAQSAGSSSPRDVWASAQDKVRGRTDAGTEKLENALREERGKTAKLDSLFKDAQDKLRRGDDGS